MAEGLVGGVLGGEDDKSEIETPEAVPGTEAFAAAVAAKLAGNDPGVARKTEEFLSDQSYLLKLQARHLQDEHALRIAHLRNQAREGKVRRFSLRLRVGFQLFIAFVAAIIGIAAAIMIRDAFASRRVVIEAFDAPPALAARGLTGKVVATGLLDELNRLQDATRSLAAARTLSSAWSSDIKLEVPETGVPRGALSCLVTARFGHEVHVDGGLIETAPGGLALTVLGNGVPAK